MSWRVDTTDAGLEVTVDGRTAPLSWRWLRDHGEDPASFDPQTKQRRIDALGAAPSPARATQLRDDRLELDWPDEPRSTWISRTTLEGLITGRDGTAPASVARPWRGADDLDQLESHEVTAVLADDEALRAWLHDLATWGFARGHGFDGSHDQARRLADRIGYVRESIFGGLWDLASDLTDHDDTAYSQSFLAPHTDGTYSHEAPGLQMFCCVERSGPGGDSVVVDGMAIADDLARTHPDLHEILTTVPVPAHYIEPGVELRAERPAIRRNDDGSFVQLSLNNYDRSPMLLADGLMDRFYEAYGTLQRMADDRTRWHTVRLERGDVLINDNWRVLHGRLEYRGARHFVGCYLNHEDFESRCRTLGIGEAPAALG